MIRYGVLVALAAACSPAAPPAAQTTPVPSASVAVAPPPPAVVEDAGPPKPLGPTSKCKPLGPNQVSDEDHPDIAGVTQGDPVMANEWLEKRGVSKKAAVAWYASRFGTRADDAEMRLSEMFCQEAKVGDPVEDALVCSTLTITSLMPRRLVGIVVRKKQPVTVFQIGLGLGAMDFPDAHHLDLAFRLSADGKSFDVFDRAPNDSELVFSERQCLARENFGGPPMPSSMAYPATLHDCDGAKKILAEMAASSTNDRVFRGEVASAKAFVTKACSDRGHWTWNKDRFTK